MREVAQGEFRIPGFAARRLARAVRSPSVGDGSELLGTLTEREREILKLFAQGLSYQELGEIRSNSALTVRNAVSGLQRKLGFKTRQQMVIWAVRTGLVNGGSSRSLSAEFVNGISLGYRKDLRLNLWHRRREPVRSVNGGECRRTASGPAQR